MNFYMKLANLETLEAWNNCHSSSRVVKSESGNEVVLEEDNEAG
ncbi:MAG: conserved hypothetical protein [Methanobrevibacter sp. CfCl-M3]